MSLFGPWPLRIVAIIDESTPEICRRENERLVLPYECETGLPIPHEVARGELPCLCRLIGAVKIRPLETEP